MTPLLAGRDLELALLLLLEDLLEELPEFDPSFLLESAWEMILSWLWLMLLFRSTSLSALSRQKVPKPTMATTATMIVMLSGVRNVRFTCCLAGITSTQGTVCSMEGSCCSIETDGNSSVIIILSKQLSVDGDHNKFIRRTKQLIPPSIYQKRVKQL